MRRNKVTKLKDAVGSVPASCTNKQYRVHCAFSHKNDVASQSTLANTISNQLIEYYWFNRC